MDAASDAEFPAVPPLADLIGQPAVAVVLEQALDRGRASEPR